LHGSRVVVHLQDGQMKFRVTLLTQSQLLRVFVHGKIWLFPLKICFINFFGQIDS